MSRPTYLYVDSAALLNNVKRVKQYAHGKKIIAMVKANAYGCGLPAVLPSLEPYVDAFGVACLEEAMAVRELSSNCECILFQGIFSPRELELVVQLRLQCVIHQREQLNWILTTPLPNKLKVWVKINTGMHRLGFEVDEVPDIVQALINCPWIDANMGLMTHFACADEPNNMANQLQLEKFNALPIHYANITRSTANSAAIIALPDSHADMVRPGIMLYGVSPFADQTGQELGLEPVMHFVSAVTAIHHYPAHSPIGYGSTWQSDKPSIIGVVAVGYGDGYPRHIASGTPVWVGKGIAPIVGRVSMDMLTIDITNCPNVNFGDSVELWGKHLPVECIAKSAGTIPYELLCQVSRRVIRK
ncbi:MAG: alanine racemase [Legionellaceae bacterium]|nr:alanine racemase [Legionellaceae bacterium]